MSSTQGIKSIMGAANLGLAFKEPADAAQVLEILEEYNVHNIDTSQRYPNSQETIGASGAAAKGFTIDTKDPAGVSGHIDPKTMAERFYKSLETIGTKQLDVFYLHAPDATTPLDDYVPIINKLHQEGGFKRFGISNFQDEQVVEMYEYCKSKGFVLPSVYQGNYNAFARKQETTLFPILRKYGMSFYAYSPLAGGFLTKTREQVEAGAGRFGGSGPGGNIYSTLYKRPLLLNGLAEWSEIAEEEGCSRSALAYRWVAYNSPLKPDLGDGLIIGASNFAQLRETLENLKLGPLKDSSARRISELWEKIKDEAPQHNI